MHGCPLGANRSLPPEIMDRMWATNRGRMECHQPQKSEKCMYFFLQKCYYYKNCMQYMYIIVENKNIRKATIEIKIRTIVNMNCYNEINKIPYHVLKARKIVRSLLQNSMHIGLMMRDKGELLMIVGVDPVHWKTLQRPPFNYKYISSVDS